MKKTLLLTAAFGLFVASSASAFTEQFEDGLKDPTKTLGQIRSVEKLDEAIKQRQYYYLKNKIRNNAYKNRKNQWYRHILSRANANTNEVSTFTDREGELKFSPYYSKRRGTSNASIAAPNNPKRNFRTRAYDYYVEGGSAGAEALKEDVILSSEHQAPSRYWFHSKNNNASTADLVANLRNIQRNRVTSERVPTGYQSTTFRRGDSRRNFLHPFMDFSSDK